MSKNLTRKGLAFGALVALGSSVIAGTPAFAANEVSLSPTAGTSYSFISGETYSLTAATGSLIPSSSYARLKTKVTNNSAIAFTTGATQTGAAFSGTGAQTAGTASVVIKDTDGTGATASSAAVTLAVAASAAGNFTVQSWLDDNGNDTVDAGEFASDARTVTFVLPANLTTTTVITAPIEGDTTVAAGFKFNDINNEQLTASHAGVLFTKGDGSTLLSANVTATELASNVARFTAANTFANGQTVTIAGHSNTAYNVTGTVASRSASAFDIAITNANIASASSLTGVTASLVSVKSNVAWSTTNSNFAFTTDAVTALVAAGAVKAQPLYNVSGTVVAANTVGTAVTASVATRKAATIVGGAVASTTAKDNVAGTSVDAKLNSTFAVKALVKDGATTPVAVANQAVTATIATGLTLTTTSPAKTLTINGTTYSSAAALPGQTGVSKLALTTNAAGEAIINVTTTGFAAGEAFTVVFYTENLTSSTLTVTARAATYTLSVNDASAVASAVDGGTVPVAVRVIDQFGGAPADSYDVTATLQSSSQATTQATTSGSNANVALVGGATTITLAENGTGNGTNVYNLEAKERLAGNVYGSTIVTAVPYSVKIVDAANLVAGTVTSATGVQNTTTKVYEVAGPVSLSLNDLKSADTRKVLETAPTFTNNQALSGTVTTAATSTSAAVAIAGAKVTISGAGLQFNAGSVYSSGSITVATDASGAWSAAVASNKAGKQTITVTSGAATATITVVFKTAAADTATEVVATAEATSLSGRTLTFSGTLTDKYGNAVFTTGNASGQTTATTTNTFSVAYAGPGYVLSTLPTATDADGKFSFRVLLGVNDSGSAVVTVKYDADGAGTAATEIVKTATTLIGAAAPAAVVAGVSGGTGKFNVSVANAAGKSVVVKVAGKFFRSFAGSAAKKTVALKAPKGSHKVTVYVGGKLVASKTVSVK